MSLVVWLLMGYSLLASLGCATPMYHAQNLPPQYHAKKHVNARHIDLSRLPRSAIPAEWLQAGDAIQVSIATGVEEGAVPNWDVDIDGTGAAEIPLVGHVPVAGLPPNLAAMRIRDEAIRKGLYVSPNVSVRVVEKRTYDVAVVGAVNKPQTYEIPVSSCDLLTALSMAEGLALDAESIVEIRHTPAAIEALSQSAPPTGPDGRVALVSYERQMPPQVVRVDLTRIETLRPEDLRLLDGSVVSVTRRTQRNVNVMGLVARPSTIEMPDGEDLTLLAAIAQAGGPRLSVANKVEITRIPAGSKAPITIRASLTDARSGGADNLVLAPGDTVTILETPTTVVVEAIRTFFNVGFNAPLTGL